MSSRASRRATLKDIQRVYDKHGYLPDKPATAFALVRELDEILSQKTNLSRAAAAAARAVAVYDRAMKEHGVGALACQKGCFYCCTTAVSASAPEVFMIAKAFRAQWRAEGGAFRPRFMAAESVTRGLSVAAREQKRFPCALLIDNACTAYNERPLTCRAYASTSLQACVQAFNLVSDDVPVPPKMQHVRAVIYAALRGALAIHNLDGAAYELGHALSIALEDSKAETRWLSGEAVFGDVMHEARQGPAAQRGDLLQEILVAGALAKEMPPNAIFAWPEG